MIHLKSSYVNEDLHKRWTNYIWYWSRLQWDYTRNISSHLLESWVSPIFGIIVQQEKWKGFDKINLLNELVYIYLQPERF